MADMFVVHLSGEETKRYKIHNTGNLFTFQSFLSVGNFQNKMIGKMFNFRVFGFGSMPPSDAHVGIQGNNRSECSRLVIQNCSLCL